MAAARVPVTVTDAPAAANALAADVNTTKNDKILLAKDYVDRAQYIRYVNLSLVAGLAAFAVALLAVLAILAVFAGGRFARGIGIVRGHLVVALAQQDLAREAHEVALGPLGHRTNRRRWPG